MEILYSIFIGMISSKIARKIDGIVLQCRRDMSVRGRGVVCRCFKTGLAHEHVNFKGLSSTEITC